MNPVAISADLLDALAEALAERLADRLRAELPEPRAWLTVAEAAEYMRCAPQRIYDLRSQGKLRHAKDGSRLLFRREWLDDYLQGCT